MKNKIIIWLMQYALCEQVNNFSSIPDLCLVVKKSISRGIDKTYYVSICMSESNDGFDVQLYSDRDHEESIDGGGLCEYDDLDKAIKKKDIDTAIKLIDAKADFIHELCFTY